MKEINITKEEANQRIDRYIRKLMANASLGFIYKQIRKKNIVVNDLKVNEKYLLQDGDIIKIYFSDETIEKLSTKKTIQKSSLVLDIVYEDENIAVINKPLGLLSHSAKGDYKEENVVDAFKSYLMDKGEYKPSRISTFSPSIANRLDRNTSGLMIGAKNYEAIQEINKAQRQSGIKKYYYTIVSGKVTGENIKIAYLEKDTFKENQVIIGGDHDNKKIITGYKSIKTNSKYSLLEIDLITGRTHQIRAHLAYLKMPIIGDRKYGYPKINKYFKEKYGLNNQLLHCNKLIFSELENNLAYLNDKEIMVENTKLMNEIIKGEGL